MSQRRKSTILRISRSKQQALYAELLRAIREDGAVRDEIRRELDYLPPWTPFEDVTARMSSPIARKLGITEVAKVVEAAHGIETDIPTRAYQNSRYFVQLSTHRDGSNQLSIRTVQNDARHDWRELQRIKNELCGPAREAIEMYPAESRLVDTANQFYLFVLPPEFRVPFGFESRMVIKPGGGIDGSNQRPWEPGQEPEDARVIENVEILYKQMFGVTTDGGATTK